MRNTVKQSLGFGIGAVGKDMVYAFVSGFILYYYNDILGISGTFTGVMMMAARVFDAFNDPLMGVVVEKTNTRFGKFRPWILTGTLTNALILYGMFAMPTSITGTRMLVYASIAYVLWGIAYTLMDIPFWNMIPAIDHVFIGCSKQVGEHKIIICQLVLIEMPDKLNEALICNDLLVLNLFCKINVLQNAIKLDVFFFYGNKGAFQLGSNIHFDMEQSRPAIAVILALPTRLTRHKKSTAVRSLILKKILQFFRRQIIFIFRFQFFTFLHEVIGKSL